MDRLRPDPSADSRYSMVIFWHVFKKKMNQKVKRWVLKTFLVLDLGVFDLGISNFRQDETFKCEVRE